MRSGVRLLSLIVMLELIVACGTQRQASSSPPGLVTVIVAAGPISPVARPGQATTRLVHGATIEVMRASKVVAVARTDRAGRSTLTLRPGTYVIRVTDHRYLSKQSTRTVSVASGQALKVNFVLDTGIR